MSKGKRTLRDEDLSFASPPSTGSRNEACKKLIEANQPISHEQLAADLLAVSDKLFVGSRWKSEREQLKKATPFSVQALLAYHAMNRLVVTAREMPTPKINSKGETQLYSVMGHVIVVLKDGFTTADVPVDTGIPLESQVMYCAFNADADFMLTTAEMVVPKDISLCPEMDKSGKPRKYPVATESKLAVEISGIPLKPTKPLDAKFKDKHGIPLPNAPAQVLSTDVDAVSLAGINFMQYQAAAYVTANSEVVERLVGPAYSEAFGPTKLSSIARVVQKIADIPNDVNPGEALPVSGAGGSMSESDGGDVAPISAAKFAQQKMDEEVVKMLKEAFPVVTEQYDSDVLPSEDDMAILRFIAVPPAPWPEPRSWRFNADGSPARLAWKSRAAVIAALKDISISDEDGYPHLERLIAFLQRMNTTTEREASLRAAAAAIRYCRAACQFVPLISTTIKPVATNVKDATEKQKRAYNSVSKFTMDLIVKKREEAHGAPLSLLDLVLTVSPDLPKVKSRRPAFKHDFAESGVNFSTIKPDELIEKCEPMFLGPPGGSRDPGRVDYYHRVVAPTLVREMLGLRHDPKSQVYSNCLPQVTDVYLIGTDNKPSRQTWVMDTIPVAWTFTAGYSFSAYKTDKARGLKLTFKKIFVIFMSDGVEVEVPWESFSGVEIVSSAGLDHVDKIDADEMLAKQAAYRAARASRKTKRESDEPVATKAIEDAYYGGFCSESTPAKTRVTDGGEDKEEEEEAEPPKKRMFVGQDKDAEGAEDKEEEEAEPPKKRVFVGQEKDTEGAEDEDGAAEPPKKRVFMGQGIVHDDPVL